jgi:hypothetical protein
MTTKETRRRRRLKRKRIAKRLRIIRELERALGMSLGLFRLQNDPWRCTTKGLKPLPDDHQASRFYNKGE